MADADLDQSSIDSISLELEDQNVHKAGGCNLFTRNSTLFCEEHSSKESKLEFSEDEETLITRMFNLVGERWGLIAGRIPGRTAEEIEKYWTSRCCTRQ